VYDHEDVEFLFEKFDLKYSYEAFRTSGINGSEMIEHQGLTRGVSENLGIQWVSNGMIVQLNAFIRDATKSLCNPEL
jgi:hypothetical protein